MAHSPQNVNKSKPGYRLIPVEDLYDIVAGFNPQEIGLARAWEEFYQACQAGGAHPELLQAVHDIKESIEDAEGAR